MFPSRTKRTELTLESGSASNARSKGLKSWIQTGKRASRPLDSNGAEAIKCELFEIVEKVATGTPLCHSSPTLIFPILVALQSVLCIAHVFTLYYESR